MVNSKGTQIVLLYLYVDSLKRFLTLVNCDVTIAGYLDGDTISYP